MHSYRWISLSVIFFCPKKHHFHYYDNHLYQLVATFNSSFILQDIHLYFDITILNLFNSLGQNYLFNQITHILYYYFYDWNYITYMSHFASIQNFIGYSFGATLYYFDHFVQNTCLDPIQFLMFVLYLIFDEVGLHSTL